MPHYQITLVANPGAPSVSLKRLFQRVSAIALTSGGLMRGVDHLGVRMLAMPMKKHQKRLEAGRYLQLNVQVNPLALRAIEKTLLTNEEIMRAITMKQKLAPRKPKIVPRPDYTEQSLESVQLMQATKHDSGTLGFLVETTKGKRTAEDTLEAAEAATVALHPRQLQAAVADPLEYPAVQEGIQSFDALLDANMNKLTTKYETPDPLAEVEDTEELYLEEEYKHRVELATDEEDEILQEDLDEDLQLDIEKNALGSMPALAHRLEIDGKVYAGDDLLKLNENMSIGDNEDEEDDDFFDDEEDGDDGADGDGGAPASGGSRPPVGYTRSDDHWTPQ